MPMVARLYIAAVLSLGLFSMAYAVAGWTCRDPGRFATYLAIALASSLLKVQLPGITGTMSVNHVFVLLSMMELGYSETLVLGCSAILLQTVWRSKARSRVVHLLFNVAGMALAVTGGYRTCEFLGRSLHSVPVTIGAAASVFFLLNTLSVAGVVSLTERKSLAKTWHECYFWSFPYYLAGAAIAALISLFGRQLGWQTAVLAVPVIVFIYRSYRLYLGRLESEKSHAEQVSELHLRTIEALALAIEAKDQNTHEHLQRVQVYAVEMGKQLGLDAPGLQALRAASILHDIGKLAVPEHIISKPGRLTPEEFEKMKIHPVVGAEILYRVSFPIRSCRSCAPTTRRGTGRDTRTG